MLLTIRRRVSLSCGGHIFWPALKLRECRDSGYLDSGRSLLTDYWIRGSFAHLLLSAVPHCGLLATIVGAEVL